MTEQEWLGDGEIDEMLEFVRGKVSERKLRLIAVACCRCGKDALTKQGIQNAINLAERFADGLASTAERDALLKTGSFDVFQEITPDGFAPSAAAAALWPDAGRGAEFASQWAMLSIYGSFVTYPSVSIDLANYLRDIVGNPFRPVTVDPTWLTSTVVSLAQGIYDERALDQLPILADALEDAGCDSPDILNHCRQPGEHVRGCWVVDLLLEKK